MRVLIVDDDVPTRVGLRTILSPEPDIEVVGEAASAQEAIEAAKTLRPDIILMDVRLPDENGIEATGHILENAIPGEPGPRVIVLTTFENDEYAFRSLQAGASGFLLKRMRAEDLVDAVRTVAEGNALPAPARTKALISAFTTAGSGPPRSGFVDELTPREVEILVHVARGYSNAEIAEALSLSVETVRTHVKHVYMKCGARDRAHAVIIAYESGLVRPST